MDREKLKNILKGIKTRRISLRNAMRMFEHYPFSRLGFAMVDTHRELRQGFPEIVMGERKTAAQICEITGNLAKSGQNVLITRLTPDKFLKIKKRFRKMEYNTEARTARLILKDKDSTGKNYIAVVTAGTSDIPVAEEAAETAEFMGAQVMKIYDVGVAGIHRLFSGMDVIRNASAIVVVAGMEGALPSVVGGLVAKPVIAVPTSIGYGASMGGLAALFGILNSCVPNVSVVNIDNGFGAGFIASLISKGAK
ncbi:MAG TPA: nickel pincer cofactor biosynthesis protein LarB [bacterium]